MLCHHVRHALLPQLFKHLFEFVLDLNLPGMKCTDCGYNAHAKCVPDVPKQCSRRGSAKEASSTAPRQPSEETSSAVGTPSTPVEPGKYHSIYLVSHSVIDTNIY